MSNAIIAFLVAVGITGWLYAKLARSTGGAQTRNVVIAVAIAGAVIFAFVLLLLGTFIKSGE